MSITREQRTALQRQDWGDDEDEVLIPDGGINGTQCYHAHDTCPVLRRKDIGIKTITREGAKRRWLAPCRHCVPLQELPR